MTHRPNAAHTLCGRSMGSGVRKDFQEILGVEAISNRGLTFAKRLLEARHRVLASLDMRIIAREPVKVVCRGIDERANILERHGQTPKALDLLRLCDQSVTEGNLRLDVLGAWSRWRR